MLQRLREFHSNLDISALEEEFGRPTKGRPNITATEEAAAAPGGAVTGAEMTPGEAKVGAGAIVPID